jgi:hypothetical protein
VRLCDLGWSFVGSPSRYCVNVSACMSETTRSPGRSHDVARNSAATPRAANGDLESEAGHPRSMKRESQASFCTELRATVTSRM